MDGWGVLYCAVGILLWLVAIRKADKSCGGNIPILSKIGLLGIAPLWPIWLFMYMIYRVVKWTDVPA